MSEIQQDLFSPEEMKQAENRNFSQKEGPVTCLGMEFENDEARRAYFREELRKKLPELRKIEGFPIGEDDDIINLSDPPYYTACPNPWLNDFIDEWEKEKVQLEKEGKRKKDFEVKEPYASDVSEGKKNAVYGAHSYHTKVPHPAIMRYLMHYSQPGDIVFDGFSGTGMTGVACQMMENPESSVRFAIESEYSKEGRLNSINWGKRKCLCIDLSPLASYIAYNYVNCVNIQLFDDEYKSILQDLNEECSWMYKTKDNDDSLCNIDYIVWSEVFCCPNCGEEIVFYNNAVDENGDVIKDIVCPHCGISHQKRELQIANTTIFDKDINENITQCKYIPVLIVYTDNSGNTREKEPDSYDLEIIKKIDKEDILSWYPTNAMMGIGKKWGDTWRAGIHNGITNVHHFYLKRSLRTLSYLYQRIDKCQPEWKAVFLSIITALSKQQRYRANSGFPNMILSGTMYIGSMIREWNPISWFQGKVKGIKKLLKVNYRIGDNVLVQTQSSTQIPLSDCTVDYIFTDPPFGDNLMYSELNYNQESWLKVHTNIQEEAIENTSQNKGLYEYQNIMSRCFAEFYRILKSGKWMTVEFSNTSSSVWNCIQNSLTKAGFVIVSVAALDKKQNSYKAIVSTVAVKQDLVITCYKPSKRLLDKIAISYSNKESVWDFLNEHFAHLPVHLERGDATTTVVERSPKILYDRLISYYVQHGYQIPMDAQEFQAGLRERFIERDGMYFTAPQAAEYEEKRKHTSDFVPMGLIVSDEANGIEWLKLQLKEPKTYQEISPEWMQAVNGLRKGDVLPELKDILEENFIEDETGHWHVPDLEKQIDLEKLKHKSLMKEFNLYKEMAQKPRARIKEVRVEALREGFKQCFKDKDFATILLLGDKIPQNILTEDEVLLQYYDIAQMRS